MAIPSSLAPAKVIVLAVHFATQADIDNLSYLTAQHASVLRSELVLRILLTHLPETTKPDVYVAFLQSLAANEPLSRPSTIPFDTSAVDGLSDEQAIRRVKKLRLLHLTNPDAAPNSETDPLTSFLFIRGYRMDEEAGMLALVPELLMPFLEHAEMIQTWLVSTVLPLLRRNHEYYPQKTIRYSLREFENLPDKEAVDYLLAETGSSDDALSLPGRDFRGLLGPWLYNDSRWKGELATEGDLRDEVEVSCPGWEHALDWLLQEASKSWGTALKTIEQWDGADDIDLVDNVNLWFQEPQQRYLDQTYARAALACAYLTPDNTIDALQGAFTICTKIRSLLDEDCDASLLSEASLLPPAPRFDTDVFLGPKTATLMRNDLLKPHNPLTALNTQSTSLLLTLVLSAFLLTRAGVPCSVRRAGDLAFLQDQREQKSELTRLIRTLSGHSSKADDSYWRSARKEMLWLHTWGRADAGSIKGVFGSIPAEFIETEILKALLSSGCYSLARSLYEEGAERPLSAVEIQDTVQNAALSAFDNASNPNRSRGGLKKCDEIIHTFSAIMGQDGTSMKRIEALLKATHALSDYRLVLKQGEPFSPVVLRVHSDPISIIEKVLEQNKKAYTRLQEFLELGNNMVVAGLPTTHRSARRQPSLPAKSNAGRPQVENRIVAMCIEAALREDDFETAYSYVLSRLGTLSPASQETCDDQWSWKAALDAGKYVRTERSLKPTHLGTASGNPEIRHLEQRIECLATALRIAPPSQLQEVLKTFRRCEEQLDFAVKEEAAKEEAWDAAGDMRNLPGSFEGPDPDKAYPPRNITASAVARQADEAPMSLFDLSRATARVASRNLTALSSLPGIAQGTALSQPHKSDVETHDQQRTRKRDQLREAATGTLVSGVGWLIGANRPTQEEQH